MNKGANERNRPTSSSSGVGSGAHNRTTDQNRRLGRKGGKTITEKTALRGFGSMEKSQLKEATSKGGKKRWAKPIST